MSSKISNRALASLLGASLGILAVTAPAAAQHHTHGHGGRWTGSSSSPSASSTAYTPTVRHSTPPALSSTASAAAARQERVDAAARDSIGSTTRIRTADPDRFLQSAADQRNLRDIAQRVYERNGDPFRVNSGFRDTPPSRAHDRGAIDLPIPRDAEATAAAISREVGPSVRGTTQIEYTSPNWSRGVQGPQFPNAQQMIVPYNNGLRGTPRFEPQRATGDHIHVQPAIPPAPRPAATGRQTSPPSSSASSARR